MRKLTLSLDDLQVETFRTTDEVGGMRATVRGHLDDNPHQETQNWVCTPIQPCGSHPYSNCCASPFYTFGDNCTTGYPSADKTDCLNCPTAPC